MNRIKGRASHHLRQEFPELLKLPTLWTPSYFVSTAGISYYSVACFPTDVISNPVALESYIFFNAKIALAVSARLLAG
jgi:hypothetical protein